MPTNTCEKNKRKFAIINNNGEYIEILLLLFIVLFEFHIHILHLPFQMNECLLEFC